MDNNKNRTVFDCAKDDCEDLVQIEKTLGMLAGHGLVKTAVEIHYRKRVYELKLIEK